MRSEGEDVLPQHVVLYLQRIPVLVSSVLLDFKSWNRYSSRVGVYFS